SSSPTVLFQDYRTASSGGAIAGGNANILLAAPRQLALFAYLTNYDLFNTAVLNGNDVVTPIQVSLVSDWAASDSSLITATDASSCTCSVAAAVAGVLAVRSCRVVLTATHSQPAKLANVTVACSGSGGITFQAQTPVTIWYPSTFRAETA
ncbi:hypothetical protein Agub_g66, partial [Astrephomene gubernaculifera]